MNGPSKSLYAKTPPDIYCDEYEFSRYVMLFQSLIHKLLGELNENLDK